MRFLIVALLFAFPAHAQCWRPSDLEEMARDNWNETVSHTAMTNAGDLVRLYVNPETGTWTLTIIQKNGYECPLTDGQGWRELKVPGQPA